MNNHQVPSRALTDNSPSPPQACVAAGRSTWTGPLTLLIGRSAFMFVAQATFAAILALRGNRSPWRAAAPYWTVYGTLVDLGCLLLMWRFTRTEGTTLRSLIGPIRWRRARDLFAGCSYFLLLFPLFVAGGVLCGWLLYGTFRADPVPGILSARVLPAWAIFYSCSVWWMIWSPTEEITYQGYVLPRIEALSGRTWIAVALVAFWWALQHSFLPFIPDWRSSLWRFLGFLPGVVSVILVYLRTRRLAPLIVSHWMMDILGMLMTTRF
jgi:hypothetical protein